MFKIVFHLFLTQRALTAHTADIKILEFCTFHQGWGATFTLLTLKYWSSALPLGLGCRMLTSDIKIFEFCTFYQNGVPHTHLLHENIGVLHFIPEIGYYTHNSDIKILEFGTFY